MSGVPNSLERIDYQRKLALGPTSKSSVVRHGFLDGMKGFAACLIVTHHLSVYAPNIELADAAAPRLMSFLFADARCVVYLFFVLSGYLLANSIRDERITLRQLLEMFFKRYIRLAAPYLAMLGLSLIVYSQTYHQAFQPPLFDAFSWMQFFAHCLFLQDVLGLGNLTAGTWYLCIDLQFVGVFLSIQWLASWLVFHRPRPSISVTHAMACALLPLGVLSTWLWNRNPCLDMYVIYFLGPFVLGSLIAWNRRGAISSTILLLYVLSMALSLNVEYRPRMIVAITTAGILWVGLRYGSTWKSPKWMRWLGEISYSLFLIHYLVQWIVLRGLSPWTASSAMGVFGSLILAFGASLIAAHGLHFYVERPTNTWLSSRTRTRLHAIEPALPVLDHWIRTQNEIHDVPSTNDAEVDFGHQQLEEVPVR